MEQGQLNWIANFICLVDRQKRASLEVLTMCFESPGDDARGAL